MLLFKRLGIRAHTCSQVLLCQIRGAAAPLVACADGAEQRPDAPLASNDRYALAECPAQAGRRHQVKRRHQQISAAAKAIQEDAETGRLFTDWNTESVTEQVEPALMEAHHMLPEDERLRTTDAPERLQLQRGRDPVAADSAEAAE